MNYYHLYANGDDAKNFIICDADFRTEFNLIAVCAYNSGATVVAFSIEDSHPHVLLYGTSEQCELFKKLFERSSLQHILSTRKTLDNVILECQLDVVVDECYLRNVSTYVIYQPTKDGKAIMPYDYWWGTGSMYFRSDTLKPIWMYSTDGELCIAKRFGELTKREKFAVKCSRMSIPDNWLVCNGVILPSNYVDVGRYESIFRTHNRFRVFMSGNKQKDNEIRESMMNSRGVRLEDIEARNLCEERCMKLFGKRTARWLDTSQRMTLALSLREDYRISFRQLATICRLPEAEIRKYLR